VKNPPLKIDLHVHTLYSKDASTTLQEVVTYSKKRGLDGVAITDHGTLRGALKLAKEKTITVIPGMEIDTPQGHVLALNITAPIPSKLSLPETVQRIHDSGGIAVAAHPTVFFKLGISRRVASVSNFDAVEVINSAAFPFFLSTYMNRKLAEKLDLPQTAGSDAHQSVEIGTAYTVIDADTYIDDIIEAIRKGVTIPCGKAIPWTARFRRGVREIKRGLKGGYSSKFSIWSKPKSIGKGFSGSEHDSISYS